jgi:outer membrane protein assembly factor BamB
MLWSSGDTKYVVTQDGQKNCVLDLKTGKMVWTLAPAQFVGGSSTAVVNGDVLISAGAHSGGTDLVAVRLTPSGVQPMWSRKDTGGAYCPLIHQGHVYCFGEGHGGSSWRCLDLKTGEDAWVEKVPKGGDPMSTPVLADGKIINIWGETHYTSASGYETVELVKATPEKFVRLGLAKFSLKIVGMSSPAIADGKLFFRLQDGGVACYDLRTK